MMIYWTLNVQSHFYNWMNHHLLARLQFQWSSTSSKLTLDTKTRLVLYCYTEFLRDANALVWYK